MTFWLIVLAVVVGNLVTVVGALLLKGIAKGIDS